MSAFYLLPIEERRAIKRASLAAATANMSEADKVATKAANRASWEKRRPL